MEEQILYEINVFGKQSKDANYARLDEKYLVATSSFDLLERYIQKLASENGLNFYDGKQYSEKSKTWLLEFNAQENQRRYFATKIKTLDAILI